MTMTPGVEGGQRRQVGGQPAHRLGGIYFREQIEAAARRRARRNAKCCNEFCGHEHGIRTIGWEVERDSLIAFLARGEDASTSSECKSVGPLAGLPHDVRSGEGATAAQCQFGLRAEPPQLRLWLSTTDKCGDGQV
ncbi:hypothetical protein A9X02_19420 [Mycobacterium malmoense]|nr:hypothetical protein A9X02_19420 [Mycobacterium malmoense]